MGPFPYQCDQVKSALFWVQGCQRCSYYSFWRFWITFPWEMHGAQQLPATLTRLRTSTQSTEGSWVKYGVFVFQKSEDYSVVFYIQYILKKSHIELESPGFNLWCKCDVWKRKKSFDMPVWREDFFCLPFFFFFTFFNLSLLISKKSVLGKEALEFSSVLRD